MPKTSPRVSFGLYPPEIKQNSAPATSSPLQPFSKIDDLKAGSATVRPYASYEPDFWLLNGQYKFLPADYTTVHVGMMSLAMSDDNEDFAVAPTLTVTFATAQSIDSLALIFSVATGDYARSITVAYYDALDALIRTDNYSPDSTEFSTGQAVSGFTKIIVTFHATNNAYRYLRLSDINYGSLLILEGASIKAANVVEETDPLSAEIRIGTLEMRLHSDDAEFNMLNPTGYYADIKQRQPFSVYEIVDAIQTYIGKFYLDTWENTSDTEIEFACVDELGVLDQIPYRGGIWLGSGNLLEDVIEDLLGGISVPYELDVNLFGTVVRGWLPACSYREALQQIAFAAGAAVGCSRLGAVRIYATQIASASTAERSVAKAQKGAGSTLALTKLVTGVEVTAHNYVASTNVKELYNGDLDTGSHEILFSGPMHTLSCSGAIITDSGVNYAIVLVGVAGTVVLSGYEYIDTAKVVGIYATPSTYQVQNVLEVTDATLVNPSNVATVAQRVYDYYQQRYLQKVRLFAPLVEVGNVVSVDTLYSKQIRGVIEKMDLDLAFGMTANAELVGVEDA